MSVEELSVEEWAAIVDPATESLEIAVEAVEEEVPEEEGESDLSIRGQTGSIRFYEVGCASGATTTFSLPTTAFYWNARLGFFRADTGRIGLSGIAAFPRSYYAGSVLKARFSGRLPSGMAELRAFWWYGAPGDAPGGNYWNRVAARC